MSTADTLEAVHSAWLPSAEDDRAHIMAAIKAAADEHHGEVHAATVRQHLTRDVNPSRIGAAFAALIAQKVLVFAGRYERNGGVKSGNANKPSPVYLLVGDLP
jgi:hypothetical protein